MDKLENTPSKSGRPAVLGPAIADKLRKRIVTGHWAPGMRLPTRRALCAAFDCSTITLQTAMHALMAEKFIDSRGRGGSFVRQRPPHLAEVALVFPFAPERNRFLLAVSKEAQRRRSDGLELSCWEIMEPHVDNRVYQDLVQRVRQGRLAGIVFLTSPYEFKHSPLLTQAGMPRVIVAPDWPPGTPDLALIDLPVHSFAVRAVRRLKQAGCRRPAVITFGHDPMEAWVRLCREQRLTLEPHRFQQLNQDCPQSGRHLARLLFHRGQHSRPDGLIIADDNFVEDVTQGMADAGVRAPRDAHVVAHCNFPWPPASAFPVTRLGLDVHCVLETALQLLGALRRGCAPAVTSLSAIFEEELP